MNEALGAATKIAEKSMITVMAVKEMGTAPMKQRSEKVCFLNAVCSTSFATEDRKREWQLLWKNGSPIQGQITNILFSFAVDG